MNDVIRIRQSYSRSIKKGRMYKIWNSMFLNKTLSIHRVTWQLRHVQVAVRGSSAVWWTGDHKRTSRYRGGHGVCCPITKKKQCEKQQYSCHWHHFPYNIQTHHFLDKYFPNFTWLFNFDIPLYRLVFCELARRLLYNSLWNLHEWRDLKVILWGQWLIFDTIKVPNSKNSYRVNWVARYSFRRLLPQ